LTRLDVGARIDAARNVNHIIVFKTAHHMSDRVGFADVAQELIAQPFALGRARHQTGDVDELHRGRNNFLRFDDRRQRVQARVGHRHHADVGIDGAERIVFGLDSGFGQRVKERGFADVWQADDAALNAHETSL